MHYQEKKIALYKIINCFSLLIKQKLNRKLLDDLDMEIRYRRYLAEFGEDESDIWIGTYSKSGTTWMQMILYQMLTDGDMGFDHIFDVSPWVYYSALRNTKPAKTPSPRILKSHDQVTRFNKNTKGRFIYMLRDGKDVAVSWFHHRRNFKKYEGDFDTHFEEFLYGKEYNWFDHVASWLNNKENLPILYIKYENLLNNFEDTIKNIAEHYDFKLDEDTLKRIKERCCFEYMKKHEYQLGPRNDHFRENENAPYFVKEPNQFIRKGTYGQWQSVLSESQREAYKDRFDQLLAPFELIQDYR